ncbi:MAG: hypothetical protein PVF73_04155 [Bacteroidales bacterium]|jgi:hypothetical protein
MKYFTVCFLIMFFCFEAYSQNYTRDAGIRIGEGFFASYRQFYDEGKAVEGFAGISRRGFRVTVLREYFKPVATDRTANMKFMYGFGIHAGVSYTNKYTVLHRVYYHDWKWSPHFGFDGLAGFEYAAPELPLLISAALQPYFEYSLNKYFQLKPLNFVIAFKYRF